MENRDRVQFEGSFHVHFYFDQGETHRKDVEIFTYLDAIKENAKNQPMDWLGINISLIYILQRTHLVSFPAALEWVGTEMKVCGAQIGPSCLHILQLIIFCPCVPSVMCELLSETLKITLLWKACECGQPYNAWKGFASVESVEERGKTPVTLE